MLPNFTLVTVMNQLCVAQDNLDNTNTASVVVLMWTLRKVLAAFMQVQPPSFSIAVKIVF